MHQLAVATATTARVVSRLSDGDLDRPTPCAGWTVRQLLEHLDGLSVHFATVARDEEPRELEPGLPDGWRTRLDDQLADLAVAWRSHEAWTGEGGAGGVTMPKAALGIVALDEVVLHGWDLAVAVGVPYGVSEDDVAACLPFVEQVAGMDGGPFGAPLPGAWEADGLDRLLLLSGRDPSRGASGPVG